MRLLADENVPGSVVEALRDQHDVAWILEDVPGSSDTAVLRVAQEQRRVLLTFDKDFGELAFRSRLSASAGVILVRAQLKNPDQIASLIAGTIALRNDWEGHFSVIEDDRYRMTKLPPGPPA